MGVIVPQPSSEDRAAGGQRIEGSLRFDEASSTSMFRTPSTASNRRTWTFSCWIKKTDVGNTAPIFLGGSDTNNYFKLTIGSDDKLYAMYNASGAYNENFRSTQLFRETSEWMHIVLAWDTTQAAASDRVKVYVNGTDIPGTRTNDPAQNYDGDVNSTVYHDIGRATYNAGEWFNGYISEVNHVDGQALAPTEFGYTDTLTGKWRPKKYTGDYNIVHYNTLNATGGNTILNTNTSGSTIEAGYRADSSAGTTANQGLVLAWPGNVVDGDVHDHINSGSSAKTVTAENSAAVSTTQSNFYGTSGYVNGSSDSFRVTDHADLALGSGDYTVEFWFYPTSLFSNFVMYDGRHPTTGWPTSSGGFSIISNGTGQVSTYTAGAYVCQTSAGVIAANNWNHIAIVRNSGTQKVYINGVEKASASNTTDHTEQKCNIGNAANDGEGSKGYYNDFRIYKSTAKYTSDFNPPTTQLGGNSFYLPFDGSAPTGKDITSNGNHWTFTRGGLGAASIEKATGAFPILNTIQGGTVATPGARGSAGVAVTVYNDGGGDKFYLDGEKQGTVKFVPGQTVTFDTGDTTVGGHPFRISTTSDGTHGGGSAYADGIATGAISEGTAGAATTITVPHNAPSDIYYYCTSHSGMGGSVSVGASDPNVADPYAWKCVLAVPGTDKPDFDESDKVNCTTPKKSCYESGLAPNSKRSNFYGNSIYFDNSNDYGEFTGTTEWQFGTGDYTAEVWVYNTDQGDQYACATYNDVGSTWWGINLWSNGGSTNTIRAGLNARHDVTLQWQNDRWYHIAVSRESGTSRLFLDGVVIDSKADTDDILSTNSTTLQMGRDANSWSLYYGGYMQELRVYKGISKYNKDFIPASTLPAVLPDVPSGVAYESILTEPTSGSVLFPDDGDDQWLRLFDHADFTLGTNNFTFECWILKSGTGRDAIFNQINTAGQDTSASIWCEIPSSSPQKVKVLVRCTNGTTYNVTGETTITPGNWYHVAAIRDGDNLKLYVNGRLEGSTSIAGLTVQDSSEDFRVGSGQSWMANVRNISNFRFVNGTAVYTQDFAPPTKPLTNITNTKLLCCQDTKLAGAAAVSPMVTGGLNSGRVWSAHGRWQFAGDSHSGKSDGDPIRWHDSGPGEDLFNGDESGGSTGAAYPYPNGAIAWYCDIPCTTSFRTQTNQAQNPGDVTITTDTGTASATLPGTGTGSGSGQLWTTVTLPGSTTKITKIQYPHDEASGWVDIGAIEVDGTSLHDPISPCQMRGHADFKKNVAGSCAGELISTSANPFDKDIHTARGQEAQYATWSPINTMDTNATFSDGNLKTQVTGPCTIASSIPMVRGKWYCEIINTAHGSTHMGMGIAKIECCDGARQPDEGQHRGGWAMWHVSGDGSKKDMVFGASWGSQSSTYGAWGQTWGTNGDYDVMGLALDMDNRTLTYYKNGQNMGTNENNLTKTINWGAKIDAANDNGTILPSTSWAAGDYGMVFVIGNGQSGATSDFEANFGQRPWKYPPPPGFQAATIANCYPRPVFVRPDQEYFKPYIWTGTAEGSGSGDMLDHHHELGFVPDLLFIKNRDNVENWYAFDSVRGWVYDKGLEPNNTSGENVAGGRNTYPVGQDNGFTLKVQDPSSTGGEIDFYGRLYIAYCWKAGGSKGTWNKDGEDVSNYTNAGLNYGDTSILNACSINTKVGFSIVKWTQDSGGASKNIAHGLTRAPNLVLMKHINNTSNWFVVHTAIETVGKILYTNLSVDQDSSSDFGSVWPGTTYTATNSTGVSGREMIMYSWHDVEGVQKFGQYEGNGSATKGIYVHLGFKPALLWLKQLDGNTNWWVWDSARKQYNPNSIGIPLNDSAVEQDGSSYYVDFLVDGFKIYTTNSEVNNGGSKYCYCAWADVPTSVMYGS